MEVLPQTPGRQIEHVTGRMRSVRSLLTAAAAAAVAVACLTSPVNAVSSSSGAGAPHQGQNCKREGDVVKVGTGADRIKLQCTKVAGSGKRAPIWQYKGPASTKMLKHCTILDNDYDIDDMMAIPLVLGGKHVAAIVQSEGYTMPDEAAPAADRLVNHVPGSKARQIPIIVGGEQSVSPDLNRWPWLRFFRSMMNQSNGLMPAKPAPWAKSSTYPQQVARSVSNCTSVSILIIGTYTSFNKYLPLIKDKVDRVVIMGQPIGDNSRTPGRESFNCNYDLRACQEAMPLLAQVRTFFVDIPRFPDCHGGTPAARCYTPNYEMVAGHKNAKGKRVGGLEKKGLPGHLRTALINNIDCSSFYTTAETKGHPCNSRSTWEPTAVAKGPGGEMLLWDQTAAMFLLQPGAFSLYYPPEDPSIGGKHYEPTLVNGSDAQTIKKLRTMWTRFTNKAVRIR